MKYKVLRNTVAAGRVRKMGSLVELDDAEARELMAMGRVAPHAEEAPIADRAVGLTEETKPRRRTRARKTEDG
jgi:hypothetical protein